MSGRLRTRTVTVINLQLRTDGDGKPVLDGRGNQLVDEAPVDVDGCNVQPRGSSENQDGGTRVVRGLQLFAPLDAPIDPTSIVIPYGDGARYQVIGDVGRWESSRVPGRGHLEVNLERETG